MSSGRFSESVSNIAVALLFSKYAARVGAIHAQAPGICLKEVNAVGPAFIRTPLIEGLESDPESHKMLLSLHPMERLGEVEVAELVIWLSSERASFVTGSYYAVDGGYLLR